VVEKGIPMEVGPEDLVHLKELGYIE